MQLCSDCSVIILIQLAKSSIHCTNSTCVECEDISGVVCLSGNSLGMLAGVMLDMFDLWLYC